MSTVKWVIAAVFPAFTAGSAILANNGGKMDAVFWWTVLTVAAAGLGGKAVNSGIDNQGKP